MASGRAADGPPLCVRRRVSIHCADASRDAPSMQPGRCVARLPAGAAPSLCSAHAAHADDLQVHRRRTARTHYTERSAPRRAGASSYLRVADAAPRRRLGADAARPPRRPAFPRVEPRDAEERATTMRRKVLERRARQRGEAARARRATRYADGAPHAACADEQSDAENIPRSGSRTAAGVQCTSATSRRCARKSPPSRADIERARRKRWRPGRFDCRLRYAAAAASSCAPARLETACVRRAAVRTRARAARDRRADARRRRRVATPIRPRRTCSSWRETKFARHSLNEVFGDAPRSQAAIERAIATGASYTEQELELGVAAKPSCT